VTDMKRVTVALPDELDQKILEMKKTDEYIRKSYSEVVRVLLMAGIEAKERDEQTV